MHWETGEGRLIHQGRTVLTSDHIVLRKERERSSHQWTAFIAAPHGRYRLRRHSRTLLELSDGRCGWFTVVSHEGNLLCLDHSGRFR